MQAQARQIDRTLTHFNSEHDSQGAATTHVPVDQAGGAPGTAHSALPALHSAAARAGQLDASLPPSHGLRSPTPGASASATQQTQDFLASHLAHRGPHEGEQGPPHLGTHTAPPMQGSPQEGASPMPAQTSPLRAQADPLTGASPSPGQDLPVNLQRAHASLAHLGRPSTPPLAGMQGPRGLREGNEGFLAQAERVQPELRGRAEQEEDAVGSEPGEDEGETDAAAPQTPPAEGDLEAAIDAMDADAGLQGAAWPPAPAVFPATGPLNPHHLECAGPAVLFKPFACRQIVHLLQGKQTKGTDCAEAGAIIAEPCLSAQSHVLHSWTIVGVQVPCCLLRWHAMWPGTGQMQQLMMKLQLAMEL